MTQETYDKRWKALAVLGIAYLMVVLDVAIVNVALPSIQTDLGFAPEDLQWVVSGYALTFGDFLLLAVLADHLQTVGRRLRSTADAFNGAVGSMEGRVLVAARKFSDHGAVSASKELPSVEPVDLTPRTLQAPELEDSSEELRALLSARDK